MHQKAGLRSHRLCFTQPTGGARAQPAADLVNPLTRETLFTLKTR